jgi:hypothetical protein
MLLHHPLKKVFALVATFSSACSLSNLASTVTTMSSSNSALHSTPDTSSSTGADLGIAIPEAKNLLFDIPVSNNGGRARIIL